MFIRIFLLIVVVLVFPIAVSAETSAPGKWVSSADTTSFSAVPPMWKELKDLPSSPVEVTNSAEFSAPEKVLELQDWNRKVKFPTQNGVGHTLEVQASISLAPDPSGLMSGSGSHSNNKPYGKLIQSNDGGQIWSSSVVVEGAYRLRLKLSAVELSDGVQLWVYGDEEPVGPFGAELVGNDGILWTPSVSGSEIFIAVHDPVGNSIADFTISQVAEIFQLDKSGQPLLSQPQGTAQSCLEDVSCFSSSTFDAIDEASASVAHLQFVSGSSSYVCTGGLINDSVDESTIPYLLTAHHCISTQAEASTIEAFWDYKSNSCDGTVPSLNSLQRTQGATLKATGEDEDFTLLELNSTPSGRWLMGWSASTSAVESGTILHRISHPDGGEQSYAKSVVDGGFQSCSGRPRTSYIYQNLSIGATAPGSSGAPVFLESGQIVGQLLGSCGDNIDNYCDASNMDMDGALHAYWPQVQPFLSPDSTAAADLSITLLDAEAGPFLVGDRLDIEVKTENIGNKDSTAYRIDFYASSNTHISSSDFHLSYDEMEILGAGGIHHFNFFFSIPDGIADGDYYIGAILTVSDSDSSNNSRHDSTPVRIENASPNNPPADLSIELVDATEGNYEPGGSIKIISKIKNIGGQTSDSFQISFYASLNTTITTSDEALNTWNMAALEADSEHHFSFTNLLPETLPGGEYYFGAIITHTDENSANDTNVDFEAVSVITANSFKINAGLNGAWYNPETNGQGFFIDVLPDTGVIFMSWFTFDTTRPANSVSSNFGEAGHRWVTAQGTIVGGHAVLDVYVTAGGVFNKSAPAPETTKDGTIRIDFTNCRSGSVEFDIPSIDQQDLVPIQRVAEDNVQLCEDLAAEG